MSDKNWIQEILQEDGEGQLTPKQAQILQAAVEMFAEKGYASTSTSEIAKRAGVAEGTIFRHYKTKKELLYSIVSPMIVQFAAPLFARHFIDDVLERDHEGFEDFLRHAFRNRYNFVKENAPFLKIIIQEVAFQPEMQQRFKALFAEKLLPSVQKVVIHFQEKGELADIPPETVIRILLTNIVGMLLTRFLIMPDQDWNDDEEIERTIAFLMKGLQPSSSE
ncbi:TetR/AcrR family transcriptional regulator [Pontibacillus salicampi]|uniref:TetR/AcrR family transcriptional regulator n=1 Tax=Pontibacillus salicampi TaxID=1449801 RepID=A0ABV6LMQ1_9BACI